MYSSSAVLVYRIKFLRSSSVFHLKSIFQVIVPFLSVPLPSLAKSGVGVHSSMIIFTKCPLTPLQAGLHTPVPGRIWSLFALTTVNMKNNLSGRRHVY